MESSNQDPRSSELIETQVKTEQLQQQQQQQLEEPQHEQVIHENDKNEVQVNFKTGEQTETPLKTAQSSEEIESMLDVAQATNEENAQQEETKPSISESTVFLTTSQFSEETTSDFELGVKDGNREHLVLNAYSESSSSESPSASESPSNLSSSNPTSPTTVILNDQQTDLEASNHESQVEPTFDDNDNNKVSVEELTSIDNKQPKETQQADEDLDDLDKEYEIPTFNQSKSNENLNELSKIGLNLNALNEQIEALKQQIEEDQTTQTDQQTAEQSKTEQKEEQENKKKNIEDEQFVKILGNDALQKKITQYGVEDSRPTNGQMVTISYEAYLHNNDNDEQQKLVDYSEEYSFVLGDGDVISGLDMVVSLMNRDEKCDMIVQARLAYGSLGKQPDIPPEATLLYKIHLREYKDLIELNQMQPVERLSLAEAKKLRGNFHFNRQDYHYSIVSYNKGLRYFEDYYLRGDEEEADLRRFSELAQTLLMNLALANFKMNELREALSALDRLLVKHSRHIKGLYIRGKVLIQLGETEEAIKSLSLAAQLDPNNQDVRKELSKAQTMHKKQYESEKKLYKKMMSGVSEEKEAGKSAKNAALKSESTASNSKVLKYLFATGALVAAASIGIALLARYRSL